MEKLLFAASEAYPLVKTGGLADVAGALPEVLRQQGMDVRLLLPAYADLLATLEAPAQVIAELDVAGTPVSVLECLLPGTGCTTWLVGHPSFAERDGNPYHDSQGNPWPDNADRFMLLSRVAAQIALGALDWRPNILHCNDWHTGPAIALTHLSRERPHTVFTIHSLAHMGIFDRPTFDRLHLPEQLWSEQGMEFYGQCSFIKAALSCADIITTVSPTYAREICESPGGMGLEGLLSSRRENLFGVLNGIREETWNPATDTLIEYNYDAGSLPDKALNKTALQRELGLEPRDDAPLLGFVGRLTQQKGLELILPVLGDILAEDVQLVFLGTGEAHYEQALQGLAQAHPGQAAVVLGYDEDLAHRIEAGADIFLMPSLFEPCGLNQLYSLRYGTLPVVRYVGGLADTVVDADEAGIESGNATGFVFAEPEAKAFLATVRRAIALWPQREHWQRLQQTAMAQDFSWQQSADRYLQLYRSTTR